MSDAKAAPSKGAMELADKILEAARPKVTGDFKQDCEAWPDQGLDVSDMAAMIQTALRDLLEKAGKAERELSCLKSAIAKRVTGKLAAALEPWKEKP